jgi:competence transcription factor ComK
VWHDENLSQCIDTSGILSNDATLLVNLQEVSFSSFKNQKMQESLLHVKLRKIQNYYWSKGAETKVYKSLSTFEKLTLMDLPLWAELTH